MAKTMTQDERFFWKHAGRSYDPATETKTQGRQRVARELARAEARAIENGWAVVWEWDECRDSLEDMNHATATNPDGWCESDCGRDHEVLSAVLEDRRGECLASLSGIVDPDQTYRRVIEAELADEALALIESELLTAI